jgi:hypothetical protein
MHIHALNFLLITATSPACCLHVLTHQHCTSIPVCIYIYLASFLTWTRLRSLSGIWTSLCPFLFSWWASSGHCQSGQKTTYVRLAAKMIPRLIINSKQWWELTVNGSSTIITGPIRKEQCAVLKFIHKKNNNASTTALGNCCQIITSSYIKITIMK